MVLGIWCQPKHGESLLRDLVVTFDEPSNMPLGIYLPAEFTRTPPPLLLVLGGWNCSPYRLVVNNVPLDGKDEVRYICMSKSQKRERGYIS